MNDHDGKPFDKKYSCSYHQYSKELEASIAKGQKEHDRLLAILYEEIERGSDQLGRPNSSIIQRLVSRLKEAGFVRPATKDALKVLLGQKPPAASLPDPFICLECGLRFSTRDEWRVHLIGEHGVIPDEPAAAPQQKGDETKS